MSLACAGAAKSAFKATGAPICAATKTACSTSRQWCEAMTAILRSLNELRSRSTMRRA